MTKRVKTPTGNQKGTVEDAAQALKQSQDGPITNTENAGDGSTKDEGEKPEDEEQTEGDVKQGPEGSGTSENEGPKPGQDGTTTEKEEEPEAPEMTTPVPDEAGCQQFAKMLANSPEHMKAFRRTMEVAEKMIIEKAKGPRLSPDEMETANYQRLVTKYGPDFVTAANGSNKCYYSRKSWNQMKNKNGWKEVTKEMPEVATPAPTK